jgi:hypothetical protein
MRAEDDLASVTAGLLRRIGAGLDARLPPVSYEAFGNQPPAELKSRLAGAVIATAEELRDLATAAVAPIFRAEIARDSNRAVGSIQRSLAVARPSRSG